MGVGMIYPVFATIFNSKVGGILPANTPEWIANFLYGVTIAVLPACMFLCAPILGDISDRTGRKKVLLVCLYNTSLCMFIAALAIELKLVILLILARACWGAMAGCMGIAQASIIDISPKAKKTVNLSLISLAGSFGFSTGPIIGSFLAHDLPFIKIGFAMPFIFSGCLAFINGTLLSLYFRETRKIRIKKKINILKGPSLFLQGFKDQNLRLIATTYLILQLCWSLYFITSALKLVEVFNFNLNALGRFMSAVTITNVVTQLIILRIVIKYFRIKTVLFAGTLLMGLGLILTSLSTEMFQWIAILPTTIGVGLAAMCALTLFSDSADKQSQGIVMGIAAAVSAAAWGLGSLAAGVLTSISLILTALITASLPIYCCFKMIPKLQTIDLKFSFTSE